MHYYLLSDAVILKVTGADSLRYLNSRLTNDFTSLPLGGGFYAAALNASGRTEGLFAAYRLSEGALLISDGGEAGVVKESFGRYIVADRVEVAEISKDFCLFHFCAGFAALKELAALNDIEVSEDFLSGQEFNFLSGKNGSLLANRRRGSQSGFDYLIPYADCEKFAAHFFRLGIRLLDSEEAALYRLQGAIPSFPKEYNEKNIFIDKPYISAISSRKGCYTGQEVVEKIASRGKPPKILVRLKIEGAAPEDLNLFQVGRLVGEITSMATDKSTNTTLCFAFIKNEEGITEQDITVEGRTAQILRSI